MLQRLYIKNVALIEQLEIQLQKGFNVFTGETGAGKSIIIDAVNLALGERANRELIQYGANKAVVEATFDISGNASVARVLSELELENDGELIVSRELSSSGKNVCRVNGSLVNLVALKRISDQLVDVHGQHEHQSLLLPSRHLAFLDAFTQEGEGTAGLREQTAQYAAQYRKLRAQMLEGYTSEAEREREMDMLAYQIGEIEQVKPSIEEEDELLAERKLLINAERIMGVLEESYERISGEAGALTAIRTSQQKMGEIAAFSEEYASAANRLEESYYAIEDIFYTIRDMRYGFEYDAKRLEQVEERLDALTTLKRKYGKTLADVLAYLQSAKNKLEAMANAQERRERLERELEECQRAYMLLAQELTALRKACAVRMQSRVQEELSQLGLEKAKFEVAFFSHDGETPLPNGLDEVEFMLSTNPGEPLKPLAKVASGGELSRIMLAFKAILADNDSISTLIFDEIDTGISGRIGSVVGEKMMKIATHHQVICITHLPQIAALADSHYLVEKTDDGKNTRTNVRRLDAHGHNAQIAQMMGGENSELAQKHAKELIGSSDELKARIRNNLHS